MGKNVFFFKLLDCSEAKLFKGPFFFEEEEEEDTGLMPLVGFFFRLFMSLTTIELLPVTQPREKKPVSRKKSPVQDWDNPEHAFQQFGFGMSACSEEAASQTGASEVRTSPTQSTHTELISLHDELSPSPTEAPVSEASSLTRQQLSPRSEAALSQQAAASPARDSAVSSVSHSQLDPALVPIQVQIRRASTGRSSSTTRSTSPPRMILLSPEYTPDPPVDQQA